MHGLWECVAGSRNPREKSDSLISLGRDQSSLSLSLKANPTWTRMEITSESR